MRKNEMIDKLFSESEEFMFKKFDGWERDAPHQGEKGGIRERRVADFLSMVLPKQYGVGTGHIVDSKGGVSHQTDIVIYDEGKGISFPRDDGYSIFPIECVYAVIEVKSKLTASDDESSGPAGEIYKCIESTTRIKSLGFQKQSLVPNSATMAEFVNPQHRIFSAVFAYETKWKNDPVLTTVEWFDKFTQKYSKEWPDMILILNPGCVISSMEVAMVPENDEDEITIEKNKTFKIAIQKPLMYFVSRLIDHLVKTEIRVPDLWGEYSIFDENDLPAVKIYTLEAPND